MSSSVFPDILVVQFSDLPDIVLNFGFRVIFFDLARNETILLENVKPLNTTVLKLYDNSEL